MKTGYTRFPVKEGDDLQIIGFIHAKDLFQPGDDGQIAIDVQTHLNSEVVRAIALTPTQGLAQGSPVIDTGQTRKEPRTCSCRRDSRKSKSRPKWLREAEKNPNPTSIFTSSM